MTSRLLGLVRRTCPRWIRRLLVTTLFAGVLPGLAAWLGKRLVDAVVQGREEQAMWLLAAETATVVALGIALHADRWVRSLFGLRLGDAIRDRIIDRAASLDLGEVEASETQDQLTRARKQAGHRPMAHIEGLATATKGLVVLGVAAALLLSVHPVALVVVLLAGVPSFVVALRHGRKQHALAERRTATRREQGYLENVLSREDHAKEVRLLGIGSTLRERFRTLADDLWREQADAKGAETRAAIVAGSIGTLLFYGAYVAVVWATIAGRATLGEMTMALVLFRQAQTATRSALQSLGKLAANHLYLRDLFALLDREGGRGEGFSAGTDPNDGIRFENVSFTYPGAQDPALRSVSFWLRPGDVLGIVGENGSGKSTLIKLLVRLYDPSEGRITLDGLDLRQWNRAALWRRIAAVFQDFARYKLTLGENVTLGEVDASDEEIGRALAASGADEVVADLPGGVAQRLGRTFPGGTDLSGGQWQKLALARAFLREGADLRVFDEPTAALDARAEAKVFASIFGQPDAMTVVVAHRLATLRRADEILVLDRGRVVERGDHGALLAAGGTYATLFELQAESYAPG